METERYEGWANRETWAFNLHWQNDQGLYDAVREVAEVWADDYGDSMLGERVIDYVEELLEEARPHSDEAYQVIREIGSWWRIDRTEVGETVREAIAAD